MTVIVPGSPIYLGNTGHITGPPVKLGVTTVTTQPTPEKYKQHVQSTPAATWAVEHNFGRYPSVTIIDSNGSVVLTDIEYTSETLVVITWATPTTGRVILL